MKTHKGWMWSLALLAALSACFLPATAGTVKADDIFLAIAARDCDRVQRILGDFPGAVHARGRSGMAPLEDAVMRNDLAVARILLDHGANVDDRDPEGITAFDIAVAGANQRMVGLLSAKNPTLDIFTAAGVGDAQKVTFLLTRDRELLTAEKLGGTPLHWAAGCGRSEVILSLIHAGADPRQKAGHHGQTPMHWAADNGSKDAIPTLLKNGARIDDRDDDGMQPIALAARSGHPDVVRLLLDHGADPHAETAGATPLMYAAEDGSLEVVELLVPSANQSELDRALYSAAKGGCVDVVRRLLLAGATGDATITRIHSTALQVAVQNRHAPVVKMLLKSGANPSLKNDRGETAIDYLRIFGNEELRAIFSEERQGGQK